MANTWTADTGTHDPEFRDYVELLKPRVMRLVIFTALVGLLVAPVPVHPVITLASVLCIAIGAGASGALNMWWDADIDAVMTRTANRPVPSGRVASQEAFAIGLVLSVGSVLFLGLFANWPSAALLAFTIFFYVVIYSMWLKRATPQNIVIGGASGAFPPMIGWVVATGGISLEPVLMFALIFIWTPPHFWALALFRNEDYTKAGVPMMPVVAGEISTRNQILGYTLVLIPISLATAFTTIGGPVYFAFALVLNAKFLTGAYGLYKRNQQSAQDDQYRSEKRFFAFSILYLFVHFVALLIESLLRVSELTLDVWPVLL